MKNIKTILLTFIIVISVVSCKKDYPKDIPNWLEDKIKEWRKERRQCSSCCGLTCRTVHEYSDGTKTTFWINSGGQEGDRGVYDYDGIFLCLKNNFLGTASPTCDSTHIYGQVFVRKIWEEKRGAKK